MFESPPPGFIREIGPGDRWARAWSTPDGFRRVIVDASTVGVSLDWGLNDDPSRRCRYIVPAPDRRSNRRACGRPAVVVLHRGTTRVLWGYCDDDAHLFGCHYDAEHRRILGTALVRESPE